MVRGAGKGGGRNGAAVFFCVLARIIGLPTRAAPWPAAAADADGNECALNGIASPDNVVYAPEIDTLFIAEASGAPRGSGSGVWFCTFRGHAAGPAAFRATQWPALCRALVCPLPTPRVPLALPGPD